MKTPLTETVPENKLEYFKDIEGIPAEVIKQLYVAKCSDHALTAHQDPMKRFFEYCTKSIKNRQIKMNEQGFGTASSKVIASILSGKTKVNTDFWSLDLGKNKIGNKGVQIIAKAI